MDASLGRKCLAEFVSTFGLVFIGAGAILANAWSQGEIGLLGIAAAHGLALAVLVSVTGHISGGHVNPAVTFSFVIAGRMPVQQGLAYIVSQLAGGAVGAFVLRSVFPRHIWSAASLGTPMLDEGIAPGAGILLEALLTFFLVTAVFGTAADERGPKQLAGFGIGLTLLFCILVGGPLTGASLNPARTFGPALAGGFWTDHYVYWVGPLAGGLIAALLYDRLLRRSA